MTTRRGFLAAVGGFLVSVWALPTALGKKVKKVAFGLSKVEQLQKVGGFATLKLKGREILFVRDSKTTVHAVDPTCTHKQCTIDHYNPETKTLRCPCHKSAYNLDGKVLDGPAPKPLTTFTAKLDGDRVIVSLPVEEG